MAGCSRAFVRCTSGSYDTCHVHQHPRCFQDQAWLDERLQEIVQRLYKIPGPKAWRPKAILGPPRFRADGFAQLHGHGAHAAPGAGDLKSAVLGAGSTLCFAELKGQQPLSCFQPPSGHEAMVASSWLLLLAAPSFSSSSS